MNSNGDPNENDKDKRDTLSMAGLCADSEINSDAKFVDDLEILLKKHQTSKLFTPYVCQLKKIREKARRSLKKRIDLQKVRIDYKVLAYP